MEIIPITAKKKRYLPLLLLADEQEDMIDRYLERGGFYVMEDGGSAAAVCVVTDEGDGVLELKNIAVAPEYQRKGLGKALINFLLERYRGAYHTMQVGTGDSPLTVPFYEACGFRRFRTVPNFFTEHYDHPIFEGGVQLRDMVYLKRPV
ncbi:MAG: GNAT family N-acetyltransferase [Oscillospiraceae bacterium]|nr:GNAT family N-acetyltransferase [Oscillospiraceae bacterium]